MGNIIQGPCFLVPFLPAEDKAEINQLMGPEFAQNHFLLCVQEDLESLAQGGVGRDESVYPGFVGYGFDSFSPFTFLQSYFLPEPSNSITTNPPFKALCSSSGDEKKLCSTLLPRGTIDGIIEIIRANSLKQENDSCEVSAATPVENSAKVMVQGLWRFFVDTFSLKYSYPA